MPAPRTQRQQAANEDSSPRTTYTDLGDGALAGNLTRDPELRFTPDGRAVCTMRLAETERVKDEASGQWGDGPTRFYDVIVWGQLANNCSEDLIKADRVAAVGKWQRQDWTADDGAAKSKTVLVARDLGPSLLFKRARINRHADAEGGQQ